MGGDTKGLIRDEPSFLVVHLVRWCRACSFSIFLRRTLVCRSADQDQVGSHDGPQRSPQATGQQ